jgi:drug/metabolite transporter (DMT)-like permease
MWLVGILIAALFFDLVWVLSSKFFHDINMWVFQLCILPFAYFVNILYAHSIKWAENSEVSYFNYTLIYMVVSAVIAMVLGKLILNQSINFYQVIGVFVTVAGLLIIKFAGNN